MPESTPVAGLHSLKSALKAGSNQLLQHAPHPICAPKDSSSSGVDPRGCHEVPVGWRPCAVYGGCLLFGLWGQQHAFVEPCSRRSGGELRLLVDREAEAADQVAAV